MCLSKSPQNQQIIVRSLGSVALLRVRALHAEALGRGTLHLVAHVSETFDCGLLRLLCVWKTQRPEIGVHSLGFVFRV